MDELRAFLTIPPLLTLHIQARMMLRPRYSIRGRVCLYHGLDLFLSSISQGDVDRCPSIDLYPGIAVHSRQPIRFAAGHQSPERRRRTGCDVPGEVWKVG